MVSRVALLAAFAIAAGLSAASAVAGEPETIRIEPRPFYGATVTLEEGVRVFRPLPPTGRVIVNPGGATPLTLSIQDVRITEERMGSAPSARQRPPPAQSRSSRQPSAEQYPRGKAAPRRHSPLRQSSSKSQASPSSR